MEELKVIHVNVVGINWRLRLIGWVRVGGWSRWVRRASRYWKIGMTVLVPVVIIVGHVIIRVRMVDIIIRSRIRMWRGRCKASKLIQTYMIIKIRRPICQNPNMNESVTRRIEDAAFKREVLSSLLPTPKIDADEICKLNLPLLPLGGPY